MSFGQQEVILLGLLPALCLVGGFFLGRRPTRTFIVTTTALLVGALGLVGAAFLAEALLSTH